MLKHSRERCFCITNNYPYCRPKLSRPKKLETFEIPPNEFPNGSQSFPGRSILRSTKCSVSRAVVACHPSGWLLDHTDYQYDPVSANLDRHTHLRRKNHKTRAYPESCSCPESKEASHCHRSTPVDRYLDIGCSCRIFPAEKVEPFKLLDKWNMFCPRSSFE